MCESGGGRPGLPVPGGPCCLCGRKATLNLWCEFQSSGAVCESRGGGRPGLPVPNSPYGLCGCKATLNQYLRTQELCENRGGRPGFPRP